jgi:hypothetical protein
MKMTPAELDDRIKAHLLDEQIEQYQRSRRRMLMWDAEYAKDLVDDEVRGVPLSSGLRKIEHAPHWGAVRRVR